MSSESLKAGVELIEDPKILHDLHENFNYKNNLLNLLNFKLKIHIIRNSISSAMFETNHYQIENYFQSAINSRV